MNIGARPIFDRIFIKRDEAPSATAGGLYIPDNARKLSKRGTVVAVGPGGLNLKTGKFLPVDLQVGDRVAFGDYSGAEITVKGEKYQVMRAGDLTCLIEDEAEADDEGRTEVEVRTEAGPRSSRNSWYE